MVTNDSTCWKETKSICVNAETFQAPHRHVIFNKRKMFGIEQIKKQILKKLNSYYQKSTRQ